MVRRSKFYFLRGRVGTVRRLRGIVDGAEALGAPEIASATPAPKPERSEAAKKEAAATAKA